MPLLKGNSSLSTPNKVIAYITDPKKAAIVSVRNLFEDEDYAKQFKETAAMFGKGKKRDERKYYHFKLSCAQKDNVSPQEAQIYAEELSARLFPDCECVIATHNDTKTVHSHIVINAVNPITGKKLRISNAQYAKMKDEANKLGTELGYTATDFRKKSENKRTTEESHIIMKGSNSWKENLREVLEEAKLKATTRNEFIEHLKLYKIEITRSISDYSFLHPQKLKPIRGKKLGENYLKEFIDNVITENRHRRDGEAVTAVAGAESHKSGTNRQRTFERSVSDIQREMQQLNQRAELAHSGTSKADIENGNSSGAESGQSNQSNGNGINESKPNRVGYTANHKKRDYDFSK